MCVMTLDNVDILRYLSKLPGVNAHARASVKQPTILCTCTYAKMDCYVIRVICNLYTMPLREDLHPVLKYSSRSVMLILIVKLRYCFICEC